jgi:hypothetical protein
VDRVAVVVGGASLIDGAQTLQRGGRLCRAVDGADVVHRFVGQPTSTRSGSTLNVPSFEAARQGVRAPNRALIEPLPQQEARPDAEPTQLHR